MAGRLRALGRGRRRDGGPSDTLMRDVGRRLRGLLSADAVMRATADVCSDVLEVRAFSVWLSTGRGETPRLAFATPAAGGATLPDEVRGAVNRRRTMVRVPNGQPLAGAAAPLIAARAGLLGAIFVERDELDAAHVAFVEFVAQEMALAFETATIYEQAVAARDRSEALLARVADAIVVTDPRGRILDVNEAARWILDDPSTPNRRLDCHTSLALHSGELALDCASGCALLALLPSGGDASGIEVWRTRADGVRQPMLANASVVADPDGTVSEVVHSLRDITRLKQADEAKTLFLATASHELKTPLTVIQGYSELLANARINSVDEREQAALAIQRRAVQLNKIVDRLLLSSRIETGRVEVDVAEVALMPIVTERVQALHATSAREFVTQIAQTPPNVAGDAGGITTVLDHLLDNAVKYSPNGGPVVVSMHHDDERVVMSVADRGIGMDPEQASHCFEKFWQAESIDGRRFGGTGIGLYIVRSLVEAMGGRISVDTEPGSGATFTVALRRWGVQPQPEEPRENARPIAPEPSVIREFMRQIGIPNGRAR
jgi:signal transduction histidine kinase